MKHARQVLSIAAALASSAAFAGVHIDSITRDIQTKAQQGSTQTTLIQDGMMRTSGSTGIVILKGSTILMLDEKRQQYREMTQEDLKKLAATTGDMMAKMQERLKNMSPEQRAQMEKMMGNRIPGGMGAAGQADTWEAKSLGTSDTVEGRKCQNWNLLRNGAPFEELCVVPYKSLPGKEDFQKVFKQMAEAFAELAKQVPGADQGAKARADINGYAVRTRVYDSEGKYRGTETVMTKWIEESVPASMFAVPAGYTKLDLPKRPN